MKQPGTYPGISSKTSLVTSLNCSVFVLNPCRFGLNYALAALQKPYVVIMEGLTSEFAT